MLAHESNYPFQLSELTLRNCRTHLSYEEILPLCGPWSLIYVMDLLDDQTLDTIFSLAEIGNRNPFRALAKTHLVLCTGRCTIEGTFAV